MIKYRGIKPRLKVENFLDIFNQSIMFSFLQLCSLIMNLHSATGKGHHQPIGRTNYREWLEPIKHQAILILLGKRVSIKT